jgi:hypothetical protein
MERTHRYNFYKKHDLDPKDSFSIEEIAEIAKVPVEALNEIASRGRGAWSSNLASVRLKGSFMKNPNTKKFPRSERLSAHQWGVARIFSLLDKGRTYYTADADIVKKYNI